MGGRKDGDRRWTSTSMASSLTGYYLNQVFHVQHFFFPYRCTLLTCLCPFCYTANIVITIGKWFVNFLEGIKRRLLSFNRCRFTHCLEWNQIEFSIVICKLIKEVDNEYKARIWSPPTRYSLSSRSNQSHHIVFHTSLTMNEFIEALHYSNIQHFYSFSRPIAFIEFPCLSISVQWF